MKSYFFCLTGICLLGLTSVAPGQSTTPKSKPGPVEPPPAHSSTAHGDLAPDAKRSFEFRGEDITAVIQSLAEQAGIKVAVLPSVSGIVTKRIENKTPREAIETLCQSEGLSFMEKGGVFFVEDSPASNSKKTDAADDPFKTFESAFTESLMQMMSPTADVKAYDAMLDMAARPETATKIAKAKKLLFDALVAEGFTREEALKIVIYSGTTNFPNPGN